MAEFDLNKAKYTNEPVKMGPLKIEDDKVYTIINNPEKLKIIYRNIDHELLLANGWQIERDLSPAKDYFTYHTKDNKYHFELGPWSNMVGRDWSIHVDNCDFEGIGNCCIQTAKQFNDFMKLLEIEYELH